MFLRECQLLRTLGVSSLAFITILWLGSLPAQTQDAGWWFGNPSQTPRRVTRAVRHPVAKRAREADDSEPQHKSRAAVLTETKPTGPLFAVLSISDQHISIYNSAGLVTRSKVSTGMAGHRTPLGIYTILGRERYHASNIYSGAPMPFMQRITWSGVAMHLGVVPGYPASHGCIRLPAGSAERLWGLTKIGERVVIAPHEVSPSDFAHPLLPVPRLQRLPAQIAESAPRKITEVAAADSDPLPIASPRLANPLEYGQALKAQAAADIAAATKAIQEQTQRNEKVPDPLRRAITELRAAEAARSQAAAKLAFRTEALATKRDAPDIRRAEASKTAAEVHLAETAKKLEAALDNPVFNTPEGSDALEAERKLMGMRATLAKAQAAAKDAERRLSPISILVSKKDNKVYIRQALAPVLEGPVTIRDRDAPLGTHVYIATSQHDTSSLGWTVVSYPVLRKQAVAPNARRPREPVEHVKANAVIPAPDPAQALARIEFPPNVSALISERLWTGGSLIITDETLSDETSDVGTDVVVTMR
jgi:hypothetical protein